MANNVIAAAKVILANNVIVDNEVLTGDNVIISDNVVVEGNTITMMTLKESRSNLRWWTMEVWHICWFHVFI